MKYIYTIFLFLFLPFCLYPEGTKQFTPDTAYNTKISIAPGFNCFATDACDADHRLYVHIDHPGEKIFMGFGGFTTFNNQISVILKINGTTVFGPVIITPASKGYIAFFKQAINGPDILNPNGYSPVEFIPTLPGDYDIDFAVPGFPNSSFLLQKFDVTVIDTTISPLAATDGRLWAKKWSMVSSSVDVPTNAFLGTLYSYTEDSVVTSIFFNKMQGDVFQVSCNANGCFPPPIPWDSSCKSTTGSHVYPQFKLFVSEPDSISYPTGIMGTIDESTLTVNPACDGSFVIHFFVGKSGKVNAVFDVNPAPGIQQEDVVIMDSVQAGWNDLYWNGLNGLGLPLPAGTQVLLTMTFVNGLTNLPIYDVEKQVHGYVITQIRPPSLSIATYWNDTLLASKGGKRQLTGCYSFDTVGCHRWNGYYGQIGIGSQNTVNTWWYASSSTTNPIILTVQKIPGSPDGISGPTTFCKSAINTYIVIPDPLPGADNGRYEWVLTYDATGATLLDLLNQGPSVTISFSPFPAGNMHLKIRGKNILCGAGPYGPGLSGEGIQLHVNNAPSITNTTTFFSQCNGITTGIMLQSSIHSSIYSYTASATSGLLAGYSGGNTNPISQTLTNTGIETDSVIYKVVPAALGCTGDTTDFYVAVSPVPAVTNNVTTYQICSGDITNIILEANVLLTTFSWTAAGSDPTVTGYSNSGGSIIAQSLTNSGLINQTVTYIVTPSVNGCTGPQKTFLVTVTPALAVTISISTSTNPLCDGNSAIFTATYTNQGSFPVFQWVVNGINQGGNSPVFNYLPVNNDHVTCTLTSSNTICTSNNPATSNQIIMIVIDNLSVGVSITASANPFCPGNTITFNATPVNGGPNPAYQWKVNGANAGTNSSLLTYNPLSGDVVSCIMTSNLACVTGNPSSSNTVVMSGTLAPIVTFTRCNDSITTTNAKPFKLKGGIPLGGTYSGAGVAGGIFNPATAGVGNHPINYTYTNAVVCSATAHSFLHVFSPSNLPCGSPLTDIRDNKVYPTVQIGSQCWMAEDLNYGYTIDESTNQRDNCIPEKYIRNSSSVIHNYYQWDEIMNYDEVVSNQGLCPPGWHVPSEADWNTLFTHFISNGFAGSPLKYSGFSGFNALLSGARHLNKNWDYQGFATFFWSSTSHGTTKAWSHGMNDPDPSVSAYPALRNNAYSVRCLKD